ncbi:hypothetical protein NIIDMKKI_25650 [Mycobacterium kansasii]|uniref:Uncharacterized protein n=1 Tax=Mycobacterium kansasii TaxID=1768 RepID=A0A7G1ICS6_MYCKA|nr:hypothetical protein NIIDMKKI_25650 [Mycobacterium kansasii]
MDDGIEPGRITAAGAERNPLYRRSHEAHLTPVRLPGFVEQVLPGCVLRQLIRPYLAQPA